MVASKLISKRQYAYFSYACCSVYFSKPRSQKLSVSPSQIIHIFQPTCIPDPHFIVYEKDIVCIIYTHFTHIITL